MSKLKADFQEEIEKLYLAQQREWPEFSEAVKGLAQLQYRRVRVDRRTVLLQFNPRRIANALAPAAPEEVAARRCFLCTENRPAAQRELQFESRWLVVCNPFPLLEHHLVVLAREHTPQTLHSGTLRAMAEFTLRTGYPTLYNGPKSGASAPDHLHFQALPPGRLPLERQVPCRPAGSDNGIFFDQRLPRRVFLAAGDPGSLEELFLRLLEAWNQAGGRPPEAEPDLNLVILPPGTGSAPLLAAVHPRARHRPSAYYARGEDRLVISPGAADMAGLVIVPRREDFARLSGLLMRKIFREVSTGSGPFGELAVALENLKK